MLLYHRLLKSSASATGGDTSGGQARLEAIEEEETVRMHLAALKREEVALQVGLASVLIFPFLVNLLPLIVNIHRCPNSKRRTHDTLLL